MEQFGHFGTSGEEYIIERPDTPRPWFNLLTNGRYSLELANTGQAKFWLTGSGLGAATHRFIYIRDLDSGRYWSLTWYPVQEKYDSYQCRHGLNQSNFELDFEQIRATAEVFVPENFDGEVWRFKITNLSNSKRRLAIFFVSGLPETVTEAAMEKGILVGRDRLEPTVSHFLTSDHPYNSFDCRSETFFGTYGAKDAPKAVVEGKGSRSVATGEAAVLATEHNFTLGKKASGKLNFFLGVTADFSATRREIAKLILPGSLEKAQTKIQGGWQKQSGAVFIKSPDQNLNQLYNNFWRSQALVPSNQNQLDSLWRANISLPFGRVTRDLLEQIFSEQIKDGSLGDVETTIWLIQLATDWLKETGDFQYFVHSVGYRDGGAGTILQHFIRGLNYCESSLSPNHLVTLSVAGDQALESAVLTGQLAYCSRQALPVLEHFGEHQLVEKYSRILDKLSLAIDRNLRLGRIYSSGIHSLLGKVGSRKSRPRQIEAKVQSWLIIGGLINPNHAKGALKSVQRQLATIFGILNFKPSYSEVVPDGFIESLDSPGTGENSTVLTSDVADLMWAQTLFGQGDEAYREWRRISPLDRAQFKSVDRAEPYLVPGFIHGPDHYRFGQGGENNWNGYGAGRLWQVMLERVFGIQPVLGGLKIDPCFPKSWHQVEVTRQFRGATYHVRIQNPFRVSRGIDRIIVDGVRLTGNVIRPFNGGAHFVEVTLG